jgi:cell division protein FtsL
MARKTGWLRTAGYLLLAGIVLTCVQLFFVWQEKQGISLRAELEMAKRTEDLLRKEALSLELEQNDLLRRDRLDSIAVARGLVYGGAVTVVSQKELP